MSGLQQIKTELGRFWRLARSSVLCAYVKARSSRYTARATPHTLPPSSPPPASVSNESPPPVGEWAASQISSPSSGCVSASRGYCGTMRRRTTPIRAVWEPVPWWRSRSGHASVPHRGFCLHCGSFFKEKNNFKNKLTSSQRIGRTRNCTIRGTSDEGRLEDVAALITRWGCCQSPRMLRRLRICTARRSGGIPRGHPLRRLSPRLQHWGEIQSNLAGKLFSKEVLLKLFLLFGLAGANWCCW